MRLIVALLMLSLAAGVPAAVYKWVQPDGTVIYSDHPPQDDVMPTDLPPVQQIKIVAPPPSAAEPTPASRESNDAEAKGYTQLTIIEPANDSAVRANGGQVSVKLDLQPPLHEGDSMAIMLDGKEIGQGKSTLLNLTNVDRGSHTLQAAVKNAEGGTVISSSPITFHVLRTSIQQRKAQTRP